VKGIDADAEWTALLAKKWIQEDELCIFVVGAWVLQCVRPLLVLFKHSRGCLAAYCHAHWALSWSLMYTTGVTATYYVTDNRWPNHLRTARFGRVSFLAYCANRAHVIFDISSSYFGQVPSVFPIKMAGFSVFFQRLIGRSCVVSYEFSGGVRIHHVCCQETSSFILFSYDRPQPHIHAGNTTSNKNKVYLWSSMVPPPPPPLNIWGGHPPSFTWVIRCSLRGVGMFVWFAVEVMHPICVFKFYLLVGLSTFFFATFVLLLRTFDREHFRFDRMTSWRVRRNHGRVSRIAPGNMRR